MDKKKFFRRYIYTVSQQFVRNAEKIQHRGFITSVPKVWYRCDERQVELVIYDFLPGITIYNTIAETGSTDILKSFATYIAQVHKANIYFRAGHLNNYLQDKGEFSIIDVDNVRFHLSIRQRAKNLSYLQSHAFSNQLYFFNDYDFKHFVNQYLAMAQLSSVQEIKLWKYLNHYGQQQ
ncbi:MAG: hypothetical protein KAI02_04525 [Gammaproteobacteria bacterium]|nr:hypothetical protein [Gammaproteobacteria bacterium]